MLTRILIAALAVYAVHHNEAPSGDPVQAAAISATRMAVDFCIDQPRACQNALHHAGAARITPSIPEARADLQPVDLPLPPRREIAKRT